ACSRRYRYGIRRSWPRVFSRQGVDDFRLEREDRGVLAARPRSPGGPTLRSVQRGAGFLDERRPFGDLRLDVLGEFFRRAADELDRIRRKDLRQLLVLHDIEEG